MPSQPDLVHPYDTPLSSGVRFLSELIAWMAGTWAASHVHPLLAIVVLVVLIGLPTVLSTKGDKRHTVIDTPGPYRVLLELLQYAVAALVPWLIWPNWVAATCVVVVGVSLALGLPRFRWLMNGAPPFD